MRFLSVINLICFFLCEIGCASIDGSVEYNNYYVIDGNLDINSEYFAVFGDIQEYTFKDDMMAYYDTTIVWIKQQLYGGVKLRSILEVGDITHNNINQQWQRFYNSTESIGSIIPYYVVTGNHDYTWNSSSKIELRESSLIDKYCHFPKTKSGIISCFEGNSLQNYIADFFVDNRKLYLLALEFGPRQEVLKWAFEYVNNHKEKQFILLTHEWLDSNGKRISTGSSAEFQFQGYSSYSTPEQVWQYLVEPNDNIICVLCGHCGFTAKCFSKNEKGRMVPQIMFNLQYQDNGGNGLLQLWEFPVNIDSVRICVYDTKNRDWYLPDSTSFSFSLE